AEEEVAAHYHFDLGLPYAPRGGSLSAELVLACRREWVMPASYSGGGWVTAGVDVGRVLHVRISEWRGEKAVPLFIGEVPDFDDLADLWSRDEVNFGLIDEPPEERMAREVANQFAGRSRVLRWSRAEHRDQAACNAD